MSTKFLWIPERLLGLNEVLDLRLCVFGLNSMKIQGGKLNASRLPNAWTKEKAKIEKRIGGYALEQGFHVEGPSYFNYLFLENDRRRDPTNFASAAHKVIEDALQSTRDSDSVPLLAGDGWKHVLGYVDFWKVAERTPGVALAITKDRRMSEVEADVLFEILEGNGSTI